MKRAVGRRTEELRSRPARSQGVFRPGSFVSAPGHRHGKAEEQSVRRELQRVVAPSEAVARRLRLDGRRVSDVLLKPAPYVDGPGTPWATGCPWS